MPSADSIRESRAVSRGKGRPPTRDTAAQSLVTILNLVRLGQATTRQELERESELGRAVVADRLGTLSRLALIDESELGAATGGRAPRLVRFSAEAGRILVATLDQTAIGVGIADLSGRLLMEHHEPAELTAPAQVTSERLDALFDWLMGKQASEAPLWGVSVSVPGPVTLSDEDVFMKSTPPFLPGWEGYPFVEGLVARFGTPVWLRSSVETMAMGELHAGAGEVVDNLLFVKLGKRIGAALVFDRHLYRGAQGAAGLIGQLPVQIGDRSSTLDFAAGSDMIAREGLAAAQSNRSDFLADILRRGGEISAIEVGQAAQAGDAASIEILSQSGRLIGHAVATLANMLNPEIIVLSGSIAQTNDILLAAIREAVYGESHPLVTRDLRIIRSQMSSSAGLVGAAMVAVEGLFAPQYLKEWVLLGSPLKNPAFRTLLESCRTNVTSVVPETARPPIGVPGDSG